MQRAYLIGTFDVLTVRDLDLIATARTRCEELIVGLFTDEQVLARTGRAPVTSLTDRFALVSRLRGISRVVAHRDAVPAESLVLVSADEAAQLDDEIAQVIEIGRDTRSTVVRAARSQLVTAVA